MPNRCAMMSVWVAFTQSTQSVMAEDAPVKGAGGGEMEEEELRPVVEWVAAIEKADSVDMDVGQQWHRVCSKHLPVHDAK